MAFLAAMVLGICSPALPNAGAHLQGAALFSVLLFSLPCHIQWRLSQLPPCLLASHHSANNFHFQIRSVELPRAGSLAKTCGVCRLCGTESERYSEHHS